jgi:hypothetical protein
MQSAYLGKAEACRARATELRPSLACSRIVARWRRPSIKSCFGDSNRKNTMTSGEVAGSA